MVWIYGGGFLGGSWMSFRFRKTHTFSQVVLLPPMMELLSLNNPSLVYGSRRVLTSSLLLVIRVTLTGNANPVCVY